MKTIGHVSLSIATLSMALFLPCAYAQSSMQSSNSQNSANDNSVNSAKWTSQEAHQQADQMVPAQAYLLHKLDARNMKPGTQFTARLATKVHLKNGPELPKGTELIGKVSTDDMQLKGNSKLALCITQARLKDGKMIPVKATIVGVYGPETETQQGYNVAPGEEQTNDWNQSMLRIDQIDAISGVDLHSRVAGNNSGVFVTTKKSDVKLSAGSELALAIAEQSKA